MRRAVCRQKHKSRSGIPTVTGWALYTTLYTPFGTRWPGWIFFAELGFSFTEMNSIGVNPVMVDLHLQYKAPATYPQSLYILTRLGDYAPKKLELFYMKPTPLPEATPSIQPGPFISGRDGR
jgi:hypothetical protein